MMILNNFLHCIGYHTAESLETDLATSITDRQQATSDGILQRPGLCTSLARDNYNENCEPLSGKGTLHDTVGICYQNISAEVVAHPKTTDTDNGQSSIPSVENNPPSTSANVASAKTAPRIPSSAKRAQAKRSFLPRETTQEPYHKKPRIRLFDYRNQNIPRPQNFTLVQYRDMLWMLSIARGPTPMWTGWNSVLTSDTLPQQKVL